MIMASIGETRNGCSLGLGNMSEKFDPDVDLAYIDEKIQNVLGHFRKDFEVGDLSQENLGAKFGIYGTFLPSYQRPSTLPHPNTPQFELVKSSPKPLQNLPSESLQLNNTVPSRTSFSLKVTPTSGRIVPPLALEKSCGRDSHMSSNQTTEVIAPKSRDIAKPLCLSPKKILKVRLKVGPDIFASKKAAIYCGLGLSSPSSSLDSPALSKDLLVDSSVIPFTSPDGILEIMTAFPVPGASLLSPLSGSMLCLMERDEFGFSQTQEKCTSLIDKSSIIMGDVRASGENKLKLPERKKIEVHTVKTEDAGYDPPKKINLSTSEGANLKTVTYDCVDIVEDVPSKSSLANKVRKNEGKPFVHHNLQADPLKPSFLTNVVEKSLSKERPLSDSNNKLKGRQANITISAKLHKDILGVKSSKSVKDKKNGVDEYLLTSWLDDGKSLAKESDNLIKPRMDLCDYVDKAQNSTDSRKISSRLKPDAIEKGVSTFNKTKKRFGGKKLEDLSTSETDKKATVFDCLSLLTGTVPDSDVASTTKAQDDWVCCDLCETWRLLPRSKDPNQLPSKWMCTMLDWLPGMNRCDISEEVTTNAIQTFYQLPLLVSQSHSYPDGISSEENFSNVSQLDQTRQDRSLLSVGKKKFILKDGCVTENSGLMCKNKQPSSKEKNINNSNQSSLGSDIVNKAESQHLSNSSTLSMETNKLQKLREGEDHSKAILKRAFNQEGLEASKKLQVGEDYDSGHSGLQRCDAKDLKQNLKKQKNQVQSSFVEAQSICKSDTLIITPKKRKVGDGADSSVFQSEILPRAKHLQEKEISEDKTESEARNRKKPRLFKEFENGTTNLVDKISSQSCGVPQTIISGCKTSRRLNGKAHLVTPPSSFKNTQLVKSGTDGLNESASKHNSPNRSLPRNSRKHTHSEDGSKSTRLQFNTTRAKNEKVNIQPEFEEKAQNKISKSVGESPRVHEKTNIQLESEEEKQKKIPKLLGDSPTGNASHALPVDDLKISKLSKKATDQIGLLSKSVDVPSPVKKDSTSKFVSILKEAKILKHSADRLKNTGLMLESTGLYFEAALKFLLAASVLETTNNGPRVGETTHSMHIYKDTAVMCEFVAKEYLNLKDMSSAALAYKCKEVAYMRLMYSRQITTCKDWNDLQSEFLKVPSIGESPSSSVSELDNFNKSAVDKFSCEKNLISPKSAKNHIIVAQNIPIYRRFLNYTQDAASAMDASKKSLDAFADANGIRLEESQQSEAKSAVKKVLDFSFHDIEGLLHLVRLALEISHP